MDGTEFMMDPNMIRLYEPIRDYAGRIIGTRVDIGWDRIDVCEMPSELFSSFELQLAWDLDRRRCLEMEAEHHRKAAIEQAQIMAHKCDDGGA